MFGMNRHNFRENRQETYGFPGMADSRNGQGFRPKHKHHGKGRTFTFGGHGFGGFGENFGGHGGRGNGMGGGGPGHGHGRGRSPLGRLIAHGNLHLLILHLIGEQPRHGYETIRVIEGMTGGAYVPSPGTIYPAFSMLEDQGFIAPLASDSSKKRFAITEEGTAYLEENREALESLLENITSAAKHADQEPSPRIREAVKNLKIALNQRLCRGPLDDAQTDAVADALNAAARAIEGS